LTTDKMLKLAAFALLVAVAAAHTDANWEIYKSHYNKNYRGDEHVYRRYIWQANLKTIEEHNKLFAKGLKSYYLGENEFADLTGQEFVRMMNGMNVTKEHAKFQSGKFRAVLPTAVDWRQKGFVTPVKNQGQCGSCWAFSTTGSLEGQHFKATNQLVSLSESNLVDCSKRWGNNGCEGGLMDNAFKYIKENNGIDTEMSYPYVPQDRPCKFQKSSVGAHLQSFTDVTSGDEDALQKAVAEVGPISVAIDASHQSFQLYRGGVYDEPNCSSRQLDHGVLAVGYGTYQGQDYWMVKNSWGPQWGLQGYIMMSRNKDNQCGIATQASYPTLVSVKN